MSEKIVGYILLVFGLLVILASSFSVYQIFTGKTKPINFFSFSGVNLDIGQLMGQPGIATGATQELIKPDLINDPINLMTHVFLVGFFASIGYKIASLGIQLIRPIKISIKEQKIQT